MRADKSINKIKLIKMREVTKNLWFEKNFTEGLSIKIFLCNFLGYLVPIWQILKIYNFSYYKLSRGN